MSKSTLNLFPQLLENNEAKRRIAVDILNGDIIVLVLKLESVLVYHLLILVAQHDIGLGEEYDLDRLV